MEPSQNNTSQAQTVVPTQQKGVSVVLAIIPLVLLVLFSAVFVYLYLSKGSNEDCPSTEGLVAISDCDQYVDCDNDQVDDGGNNSSNQENKIKTLEIDGISEPIVYKEGSKYYLDFDMCLERDQINVQPNSPAPCSERETKTYELSDDALMVVFTCPTDSTDYEKNVLTPEEVIDLDSNLSLDMLTCSGASQGNYHITVLNDSMVVAFTNYTY